LSDPAQEDLRALSRLDTSASFLLGFQEGTSKWSFLTLRAVFSELPNRRHCQRSHQLPVPLSPSLAPIGRAVLVAPILSSGHKQISQSAASHQFRKMHSCFSDECYFPGIKWQMAVLAVTPCPL